MVHAGALGRILHLPGNNSGKANIFCHDSKCGVPNVIVKRVKRFQ